MEIIGTCLNCSSPSSCLLVNSAVAVAVLSFAVWRGLSAVPFRAGQSR